MRATLQSETSECGLACLATVADHYGVKVGLRALRERYPLSLKGMNLAQLVAVGNDMGFQCRAVKLELDDLQHLKKPSILHWDLNHFVVLEKIGRSGVVILDPASGRRVMPMREVSRHFTGVALELTPSFGFEEQRIKAPTITLKQLTGNVTGLWRSLTLILALSLCLQVLTVLAPFYMQWVVDQVLISADRQLLTVLGLGFAFVLMFQAGIWYLRGWAVIFLSNRLGLQWMGNLFIHLLRLPLDFFEKRQVADVVSRLGSAQAIQRTLTTSFVEALIDGLMAIVTLGIMLLYSWKLATVTLLAVSLYVAIRTATYRRFREATENQLVAAARQQGHLLESIRGMQSIKALGMQPIRAGTYQNLINETVNQDIRVSRLSLSFTTLNQFVFGAERVAVIWIGALLALQGVFSVGMLIAYLAYKEQFSSRVGTLIDRWAEFRMLRLHGERLADIALSHPETVGPTNSISSSDMSEVRVKEVSFRYAAGEPYVLKNCSFSVASGESVAIVGASGSGKTTLVKLILGLLAPTDGCVEIGGQDVRRMTSLDFRHQVAAVLQDDQLFSGSILENIGICDESPDIPRIHRAAMLAAIHDEIVAMPMGYHTLIGDMGSVLSGGQKQRVILARALYRNPILLVLDEATSHLDVEREHIVNEAVRELSLTKIIIAHRPETIASADRVLTLRDGQITEEQSSGVRLVSTAVEA